MTRIIRSVGFVLALASVGLGGGALAWTVSSPAAAQSSADTPLPPGWELCVLEGVAAPATAANIADLDEWQAAEGGSTNNTAAYNPFNSLRATDVTGAAIPVVDTSNNFPAFSTWAAGCSATVATLYQPNMWVITAALRAGNVTPASAFLAVVDQSAWCAVSPAGVPCYVNEVLSGAESLPASLPVSSALNVYGNVKSDLQSYQQSIEAVSSDQSEVGIRDLALAAADSNVATARSQLGATSRTLQKFAVNEYVSSGLYSGAPLVSNGETQPLTPSTPQDSDGVVVQQYLGVAANNLLSQEGAADGAFKAAEQRRNAASKALAQAAVTLTSDQAAENKDLTQLITDVGTLEHAGACATVTITPPPSSGTDATGAASTATTTTTTTTPSTTTTTVPPTTTTLPPTTTTTTTTVPTTVPLNALTPTTPTTTTTTVPPTTTTTTEPSTTTTTAQAQAPATVPSTTTTTTAPPTEAAGVGALQGCIASFAPATST
jgi:hypothetical protein